MTSDSLRGRSIELHELQDRCNVMQEELRGAMEDSSRAMLFCQQVRKEVHALIATDLDDRETYGGIASLLSSTKNLVEKFAAFEVYLRDKLRIDEDAREARIIDLLNKTVARTTLQLQDDVRQTLLSFRDEIVALKTKTSSYDAKMRALEETSRSETARHSQEVSSRLQSLIDERTAEMRERWKETDEIARNASVGTQKCFAAVNERQQEYQLEKSVLEQQLGQLRDAGIVSRESSCRAEQAAQQQFADLAERLKIAEQDSSSWARSLETSFKATRQEIISNLETVKSETLSSVAQERNRVFKLANDQEAASLVLRQEILRQASESNNSAVDALKVSVENQLERIAEASMQNVNSLKTELQLNFKSSLTVMEGQLRAELSSVREMGSGARAELAADFAAKLDGMSLMHTTSLASTRESIINLLSANLANLHKDVLADLKTCRSDTAAAISRVESAQVLTLSQVNHVEQAAFSQADQVRELLTRSVAEEVGRVINRVEDLRTESAAALRVSTKSAVESLMEVVSLREADVNRKFSAQNVYMSRQVASIFSRQTVGATRRFVFRQWLRHCCDRKQAKRRRATLEWMQLRQTAALRSTCFIKWLRLGVHAGRRRRLRILQHSVAAFTERELQRCYYSKLRKFILARRNQHRKKRHVDCILRVTHRGIRRIYYEKWSLFTKKMRRTKLVEHLWCLTRDGTIKRIFHSWQRYSRTICLRQQRRAMLRGVLSIVSGSGPTGTCFRYFSFWKNWIVRKRLVAVERHVDLLSRTTDSDNAQKALLFEHLSSSVAMVISQVRQITQLSRRHDASRGVSSSQPHDALLQAVSSVISGTGSIADVFAHLADWVHSVDTSQRAATKNIRDLWEWAKSVDEEIHRVQRFVRPAFKS